MTSRDDLCVRLFGFFTPSTLRRADGGRELTGGFCNVGSLLQPQEKVTAGDRHIQLVEVRNGTLVDQLPDRETTSPTNAVTAPGKAVGGTAGGRATVPDTNDATLSYRAANDPVSTDVGGRFWMPANLFAPTASHARSEQPGGDFRETRLRQPSITPWLPASFDDTLDQFSSDGQPDLPSFSVDTPLSAVATGVISIRNLRGLYLALGVLQAFDIYFTRVALAAGAREANPLMTGVVENMPAFVAVKAASTAATVALVETARKRNPVAAMATIAAINSAYVLIVINNWRVVGVANDRRRM